MIKSLVKSSSPRWQSAVSTRRVSWTQLWCPADRSQIDSPWSCSESTRPFHHPDNETGGENTNTTGQEHKELLAVDDTVHYSRQQIFIKKTKHFDGSLWCLIGSSLPKAWISYVSGLYKYVLFWYQLLKQRMTTNIIILYRASMQYGFGTQFISSRPLRASKF